MTHPAFILFICVFGVFHKGLTALIQTQQTVMAAAGDEALLSCQLTELKDVIQVTWRKSEGQKDLASYTKQFGERVNPDFRDKVKFKDAGLQSSSIVIMNVTEKDEGCYQCLFNAYPNGALIGTTCLKLYGLTALIQTQQTVIAAVGGEAALSCQLSQSEDVLQVTWFKLLPEGMKNLASYHKVHGQKMNLDFRDKVKFKDAGLQSSSIVIRSVTEQDEGCYQCLFNTYPDGALTGTTCLKLYDFDEESGSKIGDRSRILIIVSSVVVVCVCAAVFIFFRFKSKDQSSLPQMDLDEIKMSETTSKDTQKTEATQIRQRITVNNQGSDDDSNTSPSTSQFY